MSLAEINNTPTVKVDCSKWCPRILRCCVSADESSEEVDDKVQEVAQQALKPRRDGCYSNTIQINVDIHEKE